MNKLFENPNQIDVMVKKSNGEEFRFNRNWQYEKPTLAFVYYDKYYSIFDDSHMQIYIQNKIKHKSGKYEERDKLAGRLFIENQIVTFWNFPKDLEELKMVANDIKTHDDIDIWTDEWDIEIITNPDEKLKNKWNSEYNFKPYITKLVPVKEYAGSLPRTEKEKNQPHILSPMKKDTKKQYNKDKPIEWKHALGKYRGESKLFRFETFENNNALYSGPPIVNKTSTIAATTVGSGSDGLIGGQNNPGDLGGEFPKKYNPSTPKPARYKQTIDKVKQKPSKKRKKGIDAVKKINLLNFKDFNDKKKKKKKKDDKKVD